MLKEVARARLAEWQNTPELLSLHPSVLAIGDDVYVADLVMHDVVMGSISRPVWDGIRLFTPTGAVFIPVTGAVNKTAEALWLWDDGGKIIAGVLSAPMYDTPQQLVLVTIDPAAGTATGQTSVPTGHGVYMGPWGDVRPGLVQSGSALVLSWMFNYTIPSGPSVNHFEARRSSGGAWSFPALDYISNYYFTEHGWTLLENRLTDDNYVHFTTIPDPDGSNPPSDVQQMESLRANIYRRYPDSLSPVLSVGEVVAPDDPTGVYKHHSIIYDLCMYGVVPKTSWQGNLHDDGYHPDWGSGTLKQGIVPALRGGLIVLTNPADPTADWAWANLPPGAGLNDWMWFLIDGDFVQVHYGGRIVLVWRMPPNIYRGFVDGGASMGFYNQYTKVWQAETPPGWTDPEYPPLDGWSYLVDSRHWVGEVGGGIFGHGQRIDADDVLVFPGDRAVVGQFLQDDVITAAPIKYLAGRVLPPVVLDRDDAELVWDAGYGHYLYPVEESV